MDLAGFLDGLPRAWFISIEVVQSKLSMPTFVAVYTASCNVTGPT